MNKERLEDWEELENELMGFDEWKKLGNGYDGNGKNKIPLSDSNSPNSDAKRVLVGAGARFLFYPTLMYNVLRNKIQPEFHWWDSIGEFILLGAVPFNTDVPRLKKLGVHGVVTLNESYESLVPSSLYHAYDIDHLVIPTRDYFFAPSYEDICQAVNFIHNNASCGKKTYVHCKAGRGRSTTIVLCYLVQHKQMTPDAALEYVRSIRPRVLLVSSQWQAVQDFYRVRVVKNTDSTNFCNNKDPNPIGSLAASKDLEGSTLVDGSIMVVTESDLDGYDSNHGKSNRTDNEIPKFSTPWLKKKLREKLSKKDNYSR